VCVCMCVCVCVCVCVCARVCDEMNPLGGAKRWVGWLFACHTITASCGCLHYCGVEFAGRVRGCVLIHTTLFSLRRSFFVFQVLALFIYVYYQLPLLL